MWRRVVCNDRYGLLGILAILAVAVGLTSASAQEPPRVYELPGEAVFPEGIAFDAATNTFFVSSTSDGTIFRGDVASGNVVMFVPPGQPPFATIGLDVDAQGRLWVAGGRSGNVRVYDTTSGELLATLSTPPAEATFINDLIVTSDGTAYITDSNRPTLFRATADADAAEPWLDFTGTAFEYRDGFNANGIVASPDEDYLVVVQMNTGNLYRITIATGEVTQIAVTDDMNSISVANGDGLVLDGQRLYVIRNADQLITAIDLAADFASGTFVRDLSDPLLAFPTTATLVGNDLLVVNSQFDHLNDGNQDLPFTVVRVSTE